MLTLMTELLLFWDDRGRINCVFALASRRESRNGPPRRTDAARDGAWELLLELLFDVGWVESAFDEFSRIGGGAEKNVRSGMPVEVLLARKESAVSQR